MQISKYWSIKTHQYTFFNRNFVLAEPSVFYLTFFDKYIWVSSSLFIFSFAKMRRYLEIIGVAIWALTTFSVFALAPMCENYLSYYDCDYQAGECETCQGYAYPPAFAYDSGSCTEEEYATIAEAFVVLYPAQTAERRHEQAVAQCKLPESMIPYQDCETACSLKTTDNAYSACVNVCETETSFGDRLAFVPTLCENYFACVGECEGYDYLTEHCTFLCNQECPGGLKGGNTRVSNYCGDGVVRESEECDDGNNSNDDGCNYNCYTEAGFGDDASDQPTDDGNGNPLPWSLLNVWPEDDDTQPRQLAQKKPGASIRDQLIARNNPDGATPNTDPKNLPHSGGYIRFQDRLYTIGFALMACFGLMVQRREE